MFFVIVLKWNYLKISSLFLWYQQKRFVLFQYNAFHRKSINTSTHPEHFFIKSGKNVLYIIIG